MEKAKRNSLEKYGKSEMIEVSEVPKSDREDCREIIYKICELVSIDTKKSKIEIAHRIKNGDIIVKFKDRISRDYNINEN